MHIAEVNEPANPFLGDLVGHYLEKTPWVFKLQIDPEDVGFLERKFPFDEPRERNYVYFDTSGNSNEAALFRRNFRLRARIKGTEHSLAVKDEESKREVVQALTAEEYQHLLIGQFPKGRIKRIFRELGLLYPFKIIDSTISLRRKARFRGGTIVLDQTIGTDGSPPDFTLEFRSEMRYSWQEIARLISEIGVQNLPVEKSKFEKFWEIR